MKSWGTGKIWKARERELVSVLVFSFWLIQEFTDNTVTGVARRGGAAMRTLLALPFMLFAVAGLVMFLVFGTLFLTQGNGTYMSVSYESYEWFGLGVFIVLGIIGALIAGDS